jgi:hypothetical protein
MAQDARTRAKDGVIYTGADAWREDIPPRTAARARTVPVLEAERARLQAELDEVCCSVLLRNGWAGRLTDWPVLFAMNRERAVGGADGSASGSDTGERAGQERRAGRDGTGA